MEVTQNWRRVPSLAGDPPEPACKLPVDYGSGGVDDGKLRLERSSERAPGTKPREVGTNTRSRRTAETSGGMPFCFEPADEPGCSRGRRYTARRHGQRLDAVDVHA
jgi:hypothetical protein